jgi:hypothetical protein
MKDTMMTATTNNQNDIDLLMSLDPLEYTSKDIDVIIAYHRNQRAMRESGARGAKPKKDKGPTQALDLTKLGLKPVGPALKRRV